MLIALCVSSLKVQKCNVFLPFQAQVENMRAHTKAVSSSLTPTAKR